MCEKGGGGNKRHKKGLKRVQKGKKKVKNKIKKSKTRGKKGKQFLARVKRDTNFRKMCTKIRKVSKRSKHDANMEVKRVSNFKRSKKE